MVQSSVDAFQEVMRQAMADHNLSHQEFADNLGVTRSRVSQLFMKRANPSLRYVSLILHRLGYVLCLEKREAEDCGKSRIDQEEPVKEFMDL